MPSARADFVSIAVVQLELELELELSWVGPRLGEAVAVPAGTRFELSPLPSREGRRRAFREERPPH